MLTALVITQSRDRFDSTRSEETYWRGLGSPGRSRSASVGEAPLYLIEPSG